MLSSSDVLHVNTNGSPDSTGATWDDAMVSLQSALDLAAALNTDADAENNITDIWIAAGTYTPSALLESGDDRSASFSLLDGVTLYGGFEGTEDTLEERDWSTHITTLSGDIGTLDNNSDNAYTVVYCGENIEAGIDGVLITGGNANDSDPSSHPERKYGGGIYSFGTLTVTNSTISGNSAVHFGGGIYSSGTLTVTNSTTSGNSARYGGGICNYEGTLTVTNSTISGNSVTTGNWGNGGGVYTYLGAMTVTNSTISGNSARNDGGGIYGRGTLAVTNSTISGNSASEDGGGIYNFEGALTVTNSTVSRNSADNGGGISTRSGVLAVANSTISGNWARRYGGGIYGRGTLAVTNSTISGNSGGGIYTYSATPTLTNSIVCLNSGRNIQGNFNGSNNLINIDPGFVRSPLGGLDGDMRLTDRSPAINVGSNAAAVDADGDPLTTDLAGNPRIADGTVDIGAFEYQGPPVTGRETPSLVVSVTDDEFDLYDGDITLREAIYYSQSGIGDGTVTFDATLDGATITLAGSELPISHSVVIDASALSSLAVDADNRSRVFTIGGDVTLRGLTITGGSANDGGGIRNSGTLIVTNSTISGNSDGGIYSFKGTLTVTNSAISGNSAGNSGGGIFNREGTLTVTNSAISGNSAGNSGGGIFNGRDGTTTVTNSTIAGNSALSGGGIYDYGYSDGTLTVTSSIVCSNAGSDIYGSFVGSNNLMNIGPNFVRSPSAGADGQWGTADDDPGDLRLTDRSLAINMGSNVLAVDADGNPLTTDMAGNPRIADGTVDIGAYEYQGPPAVGRETPSLVVSAADDEFDLYDGDITLREAIYYSQSGTGDGTVTFDATLDGETITLTGWELTITDAVVIDASALSSLTVDADNRSRVFTITGDVTLRGLTITGGSAGGIYNHEGTLTITNCTISDNSTTGSFGGGIYNDRNGTLTVTNSTISGNSAGVWGGGISNSYGGTLTVTNSTISGNSAANGGGIHNMQGATMTVTNSTILGNSATEGQGGGIYSFNSIVTLNNTIVAGNEASSGPDISHLYQSSKLFGSHNLIGDGSNQSAFVNGVNGNQIGTASSPIDPLLSDWARFGNGRWGYYLLPGSPAIDAGSDDLLPADTFDLDNDGNVFELIPYDLSGARRISGESVDIGAQEFILSRPFYVESVTPGRYLTPGMPTVDLHLTHALDEAVDYSVFLSLIGPGGAIELDTADVSIVDGMTLRVALPVLETPGEYRMKVGTALPDGEGNELDQDQDGFGGETSDDRFEHTWFFDPGAFTLFSHFPTQGGVNSLTYTDLLFTRDIDPATLAADDITITAPDATTFSPKSVTPVETSGQTVYRVAFDPLDQSGRYTMEVGANITDTDATPLAESYTGYL